MGHRDGLLLADRMCDVVAAGGGCLELEEGGCGFRGCPGECGGWRSQDCGLILRAVSILTVFGIRVCIVAEAGVTVLLMRDTPNHE